MLGCSGVVVGKASKCTDQQRRERRVARRGWVGSSRAATRSKEGETGKQDVLG